MEQTPEFLKRVLERGAGDQESLVGVEVDESLVKERVVVLQPVGFVYRQITPFQTLQNADGRLIKGRFVELCRLNWK